MLKNLSIFLFVVFLFSAFLNAQERTFMRTDGKFIKANQLPSSEEAYKVKRSLVDRDVKLHKPSSVNQIASPNGLIDTLAYGFEGTSNFGAFGQDVFLQWFKAPADLIIKGFAYLCYDDESVVDGARFEGKIVSVNLTEAELTTVSDKLYGYYPGDNIAGITAFTDNLDKTGDWVNSGTWTEGEIFGSDIWSDFGFGAVTEPILDEWIWIQTNILFEPTIVAEEIFGISYKNTSTNLVQNDAQGDRLGVAADVIGIPGWKFYAAYRNDPAGSDKGWWKRTYTWFFLVEVDITGDPPPSIESFTTINSGLDAGPFTIDAVITDANPGDPSQAGVASASLFWSLDGSTWNEVAMTGTEPNFTAEIPAQAPGETVSYYIEATDVGAHTTVSSTKSFYIFAPTANTLVVFNGFDAVTGYPVTYYFGSGEWPANYNRFLFDHDKWGYGALTADVVNYYTNIVEITTNGPSDLNSDVIRTWLEADATRNYMLAGDEWLGAQSNWTNGPHAAGEFIFDILGINYEYNDINYGATGDELLPSEVYPIENTLLGGPLFDKYTSVSTDSGWTAPMIYDPYWEMGVTNWLDGVDFEADVEVFMMGVPKTGSSDYNIGGHRVLPAGNKIAFFAYDPLSLDSDTETEEEYYWYGFSYEAPQVQTLLWFGVTTGIERVDDLVPGTYSLGQNYPNPFNPSTTINFALPQTSNVTLKVYDVLGSEVATLLNGEKAAGNYEVSFDASQLASGLYIYTLNTGNFTASKKMMLIK